MFPVEHSPSQPHASHPERYLAAKELAAELAARSIRPCGYRACLDIIADCDQSVANCITLEAALDFLRDKRRQKTARSRRNAQSSAIGML